MYACLSTERGGGAYRRRVSDQEKGRVASQKSHPSAALAARLTISPINKHHAISRQVATSGWRRILRGL